MVYKIIHTTEIIDFPKPLVGLPSSRTNNKRVISTFKFGYPCLTLNERSNLNTPKDFQPMISYRLVYHPKPLGPIISKL